MSYAPVTPDVYRPPLKVGDDTYLIQQLQRASIAPLWVYLNSLVIKGTEPIIVDTGTPANREQWMKDVFSIVDPGDVRWIFLSHDDVDHAGNLGPVMEACPNATLVEGDLGSAIRAIKRDHDGEIEVAGPNLARSLTELRLIDEYRIYLHPVVLGRGQPYFAGRRPALRLVSHHQIGEVLRLAYIPA